MNRVILCLCLAQFVFPATSFAEDPRGLIAETRVVAGMVPHPEQYPQGIRIFKNGKVERYIGTQSKVIATVNAERVTALVSAIDALRTGPLVDPAEGEPTYCTDVPSTEYIVTKTSGEKIVIQREASCHVYGFMDSRADKFIKLLLGFVSLGFYL